MFLTKLLTKKTKPIDSVNSYQKKFNHKKQVIEDLYLAISKLENSEEAEKFLQDLLTVNEIEEFSKRWQVARLLDQKISYSQIEKNTGMSSTTIARISKWLTKGKGGYKLMLDKNLNT